MDVSHCWGQYKRLVGSYGADGSIYDMQSDATSILRIDPIKNKATTFRTVPDFLKKWEEGVLSIFDNLIFLLITFLSNIFKISIAQNALFLASL